ncbi:MAG TPA: peptide ABC transporter permease, partial [Hyphomonas sp.]|nr:peptide ABC transporter permease [Hyphomonas sp.]
MTDLDPLLDPTGRIEPVQNAIIGGRSLWEDARARLFRNRAA